MKVLVLKAADDKGILFAQKILVVTRNYVAKVKNNSFRINARPRRNYFAVLTAKTFDNRISKKVLIIFGEFIKILIKC